MVLLTWAGSMLAAGGVIGYAVSQYRQGRKERQTSNADIAEKIDYSFTKSDQYPSPLVKVNEVIDQAKKTLDIAVFIITQDKIIARIIEAKKRGVKVRVITDGEQAQRYAKNTIGALLDEGIPVKVSTHDGYMHLKVMIADNQAVSVGSYNFTRSAEERHDEVIVIIKSRKIAKEWTEKYNTMWHDEVNFTDYSKHISEKYA
ncbi:phosphatidylserine/phosphatidylglycerophosphate/cardiolipin synthase-like enzyme [Scopulibacillus daqui]|uniref:phospholipase D n=1 Tax=Scopulibacillus daqui TaxID=1469162 RepID=A0ABS2Q0S7_9BACL|nr:phospholipase D-like domain-containing protein [Scopulibacillus daqui]MBM7645897.1 phosphatidylserine/phosphatidylglycerophosphate/cardiolipin synthase-like enzyme [Scopulibacillus daqui]